MGEIPREDFVNFLLANITCFIHVTPALPGTCVWCNAGEQSPSKWVTLLDEIIPFSGRLLRRCAARNDIHCVAAQRKPIRGENSPRDALEPGLAFGFGPGTDERFDTRILISASPRLPPRTTR